MKFQSFLIKYGEIGIKGKNRYLFEDALMRQMRFALNDVDGTFKVHKSSGRVYVECEGNYDYEETVGKTEESMCPQVQPAHPIIRQSAAYFGELAHQKSFWILRFGLVCQNLQQKKKLTIRLVYCIIVYQCFGDTQDINVLRNRKTKGKGKI